MKRFFYLIFAGFIFLTASKNIAACSCTTVSAEDNFKEANAVFSGKAVRVFKTNGGMKVKIRVERVFKGSVPRTVLVSGGGMCGFNFTAGRMFLIYAVINEEDGELFAPLCSRTKLIKQAAEDFEFFKRLPADAIHISVGLFSNRQLFFLQ